MFLSFLLFQVDQAGTVEKLIQTLGFPVVVALALLFFAYKVWGKQAIQIEKKDSLLETQAAQSNEFRNSLIMTQDKIIATQDKIATTQERILDAHDTHIDVLKDIKSTLQTIGKN